MRALVDGTAPFVLSEGPEGPSRRTVTRACPSTRGRFAAPRSGRTGAGGFTLVEILIALVVLSVGLIAVLTLLTSAVKLSGDTVEDTFASTLARSVYEALREGAKRRGFYVQEQGHLVRGFALAHDGVPASAPLPAGPDDTAALPALRASDAVIFMPPGPQAGESGPQATRRIFVFPRPGGAGSENAWPGTDDVPTGQLDYAGATLTRDVRRVYELKNRRTPAPNGTSEAQDQYGFALAVQRASVPALTELTETGPVAKTWINGDGNLDPTKYPPHGSVPVDGLYLVEIMVYRNFDAAPTGRHHLPVPGGHFTGYVRVGP